MLRKIQIDLKQESIQDLGRAMAQMKAQLQVTASLFNDLLLLQSRYRLLEKEYRLGIIDQAVYQVNFSQIQSGFFHLVDQMQPKDLVQPKPEPTERRIDRETARNFPWHAKRPYWMKSFNDAKDKDGIFESYEEETWLARYSGGGYALINTTSSTAIRFVYLWIGDRDMAQSPMSLEVQLQKEDGSSTNGIGLCYCYSKQTGHYYAFTINNQREYKLWLKDESGFNPILSGRSSSIQPNGFNRLGIVKEQDHLFLFINDQFVREIKEGSLSSGDAGILASGIGEFFFDNLAFFDK